MGLGWGKATVRYGADDLGLALGSIWFSGSMDADPPLLVQGSGELPHGFSSELPRIS